MAFFWLPRQKCIISDRARPLIDRRLSVEPMVNHLSSLEKKTLICVVKLLKPCTHLDLGGI